jgi:hypothetical protein
VSRSVRPSSSRSTLRVGNRVWAARAPRAERPVLACAPTPQQSHRVHWATITTSTGALPSLAAWPSSLQSSGSATSTCKAHHAAGGPGDVKVSAFARLGVSLRSQVAAMREHSLRREDDLGVVLAEELHRIIALEETAGELRPSQPRHAGDPARRADPVCQQVQDSLMWPQPRSIAVLPLAIPTRSSNTSLSSRSSSGWRRSRSRSAGLYPSAYAALASAIPDAPEAALASMRPSHHRKPKPARRAAVFACPYGVAPITPDRSMQKVRGLEPASRAAGVYQKRCVALRQDIR